MTKNGRNNLQKRWADSTGWVWLPFPAQKTGPWARGRSTLPPAVSFLGVVVGGRRFAPMGTVEGFELDRGTGRQAGTQDKWAGILILLEMWCLPRNAADTVLIDKNDVVIPRECQQKQPSCVPTCTQQDGCDGEERTTRRQNLPPKKMCRNTAGFWPHGLEERIH